MFRRGSVLMSSICFQMHRGRELDDQCVTIMDDMAECGVRQLTDEEWNAVVHSSGNWKLQYQFDERALDYDIDWDAKQHVSLPAGIFRFKANTTVRDVVTAIMSLSDRYGYFEGCLCEFEGMYELQWGT